MPRKTTSIKIDEAIWRDFKIHCIKKGIDISELIEKMIKKEVKK